MVGSFFGAIYKLNIKSIFKQLDMKTRENESKQEKNKEKERQIGMNVFAKTCI